MHLFLIKLFPELDSIAPICYNLSNHKIPNSICSLYPLQDYSNTPIIKFLEKNGTKYISLNRSKLLLSIIFKFSKFINKFNFILRYLYF